jgi:hypothetical protein
MLMIIKNITLLTELQILRLAGASGGLPECVRRGGIRGILDFGI